jgi:Asp-tRNA(Asn)/Glu-tRNA(Gln) amidotransferase C subunit
MDRIMYFCAAKVNKLLQNFTSEEVQQFITSLQNVVGFMKKLND